MSLREPDAVPQDTNATTEEVVSNTPPQKLGKHGVKLFIIACVLSVILFTSCIIAGIVVALLRNDLTNTVSDYALKHVLVPLLGIFGGSLVLLILAYFRYRKLNSKDGDMNVSNDDHGKTIDLKGGEDIP
ncbi:unnamed protein product [Agarophyton chilense]